jgi:carbonic anhydrase/acetyltransferase-like protein (isoleucine patch superfamily)
VRNAIVDPGAAVHENCVVRGWSVLGAECVVESENVADCGARISGRAYLPRGVLAF